MSIQTPKFERTNDLLYGHTDQKVCGFINTPPVAHKS